MAFPPIPSYPLALDTDRSLFLVFNTAETTLTADNLPWSQEVLIKPVEADEDEIWADNGFANVGGELFYYDSVEKDSNGKVYKLKNCARNLDGAQTQLNVAGSWVRGFVVAEHHNQLVQAILNAEEFIGENFSENRETLDWRIRNLALEPVGDDDFQCPEVIFSFDVTSPSTDGGTGTTISYNVTVNGFFKTFLLDFGDGTFTTSLQAGTHTYPPNTLIDPVVTVTNDNCQMVQTAIARANPNEPSVATTPDVFNIPITDIPDFPILTIPSVVVPSVTITAPTIQFPCEVGLGQIGNIPSLILVEPPIPSVIEFANLPDFPSIIEIVGDIDFPSHITIDPVDIPSIIEFGAVPAIPSLISITNVDIPSIISFGPAPSIGPIEFGTVDIPSIIAVQFPSVITVSGIVLSVPSIITLTDDLPTSIYLLDNLPSNLSLIDNLHNISLMDDLPTNINLTDDLPSNISLVDSLPSIISVADDVPSEIFLYDTLHDISLRDDLPSTISLVDSIPSTISVDDSVPSIITVYDSVPDVIYVTDSIPDSIPVVLTGTFPSTIHLDATVPSIISVLDSVPNSISLLDDVPAGICLTDDIPTSINLADDIPLVISLVDDVPTSISVVDDIPGYITLVGTLPTNIYVVWDGPTSIDCNVNITCPSSTGMRALSYDENYVDSFSNADGMAESVGLGIPTEIYVVAPEFPEIKHDLPSVINLLVPEIPDIKIVGPEIPIPNTISFIGEPDIPEEIKLLSDLPSSILLDASAIPLSIKLDVPEKFPTIFVDGSSIPSTIQIIGMPSSIELIGSIPSEVWLKAPEDLKVPLVYEGGPIPMQFVTPGAGDDDEGPCFRLVACGK